MSKTGSLFDADAAEPLGEVADTLRNAESLAVPETVVGDEKGELPEGWAIATINELFESWGDLRRQPLSAATGVGLYRGFRRKTSRSPASLREPSLLRKKESPRTICGSVPLEAFYW
jgi:hypothetical protein